MSKPMHRMALVQAALLFATVAPRAAVGQGPTQQPLLDKVYLPDPRDLPADYLIQGIDRLRLRHDQARLRADLERGDAVAVSRDMNKVQRDQRNLWRDRRRIQGDSFQRRDPWEPRQPPVPMGATLVPHPQYPGFGYHPADPTQLYRLPQPAMSPAPAAAAPAPVSVEIRNVGQPGAAVGYDVDGVSYTTDGGGAQKVAVGASSVISYDRGGGAGMQRYALSAGVYEFRAGDAGWALFKLPATQ